VNFPKRRKDTEEPLRVRLNKAYLIIAVTAIFVLAALLSGPIIRRHARNKAGQTVPAAAASPTQAEATPQPPARDR
jgi:hypothetical protein